MVGWFQLADFPAPLVPRPVGWKSSGSQLFSPPPPLAPGPGGWGFLPVTPNLAPGPGCWGFLPVTLDLNVNHVLALGVLQIQILTLRTGLGVHGVTLPSDMI